MHSLKGYRMKMKRLALNARLFVGLAVLALLIGDMGTRNAEAAPITYKFTGIFLGTFAGGFFSFGSISPGTSFSGSFTYERVQTDQAPAETFLGVYDFIDFRVRIGGEEVVATDQGTQDEIRVFNTDPQGSDSFHVDATSPGSITGTLGGLVIDTMELIIGGGDGTPWNSDALPSVQEMARAQAKGLSFVGFLSLQLFAGGSVETLTPVPEPSTLLLLGSGLAGLGFFRWRKKAA